MANNKGWKCIRIAGMTMVSDFQRIHCTDSDSVTITPEQLGEPGQVLADFGGNYFRVTLDHYEGDDVFIKIVGKVYKVEPRLEICCKEPLSYAWAETRVFVEPVVKTPEEILYHSQSTKAEKREALKQLLEDMHELDTSRLYKLSELCYKPKNHLLDLDAAKRIYAEMASRTDWRRDLRSIFYARAARIAYMQLNKEAGDLYVARALELDPEDKEPLMWQANYEWHQNRDLDFYDAYMEGRLPLLKRLVDERYWRAMEYQLDMMLPLPHEGARPIAELCETVLMETFRQSDEKNYNAIAVVAFYKFVDWIQVGEEAEEFMSSWPFRQLEKGAYDDYPRAVYFYALINEICGDIYEEEKPDKAKEYYNKARNYFRKGALEQTQRQCMMGYVNMQRRIQPDDPELPYMEQVLRTFSFDDLEIVLYGDKDDELPDDDGRFDACS